MRLGTYFICLWLAVSPSTMAAAATQLHGAESAQPFELVRKLRVLQDRAAYGDQSAYGEQRGLIAKIAREFAGLDPALWKVAKIANAAIVYVLSGGDPRFFRKILRQGSDLPLNKELVRGALAYGEGRRATAQRALAKLDALDFDRSIAGNVALAQGLSSAKINPAAAMAYLDLARLLSPGSLIEESALRYQIALAVRSHDLARFESLAGVYFRRFPKSIFLPVVLRKIVSGLAGGIYGRQPKAVQIEGLKTLSAVLKVLPAKLQRKVYLEIAAKSTAAGQLAITQWSATAAQALAPKGSRDFIRSHVYQAAALIVTPDARKGLHVLQSVDKSKLATRDAELVNAALALARDIKRQPDRSKTRRPKLLPIAKKARDMISQVDALLAGDVQ